MTQHRLVSLFLLPGLLLAPTASSSEAAEPARLVVRVVDPDGQPVSGATVHATTMKSDYGTIPADKAWEQRAGRDGRARFEDLPAHEPLWFLIERKGFAPEARTAILRAGELRRMRVGLREDEEITGRVVDEEGVPIDGVEVEIWVNPFGVRKINLPPLLAGRAEQRTTTDRAGAFLFGGLPWSNVRGLTLRHPSYVPIGAHWNERESNDLGEIVLRRGATLAGKVTDPEGRPLAGFPVWAMLWNVSDSEVESLPPSTWTGADGSFAISHLAGGPFRIQVCGPGFIERLHLVWFPEEPLHLAMEPGGTFSGRILGPEGEPVAGATVSTAKIGIIRHGPPSTCPPERAVTDEKGRFSLGPLGPGWYEVRAQASGLKAAGISPLAACPGRTLTGIELQLETSGELPLPPIIPSSEEEDDDGDWDDWWVAARGRVVGPDGAPVEGALVDADEETWSTADGSFETRVVPGRAATFRVLRPGFAEGHVSVEPRGDGPFLGVELRLELGAVVTGRVLGRAPEDEALRVFLYGGEERSHQVAVQPDGSFRFERVLPGAWRLSAQAEDRYVAATVTVTPGRNPRPVTIRLPEWTTVSGRVLDELGEPIAGAEVLPSDPDLHNRGVTRADGSFMLRLPPRTVRLDVFKEGFQSYPLELSLDDRPVTGLELRLEAAP